MHFLFPHSPLTRRQPDELVAEQYSVLQRAGHDVSLFSVEALQEEGTFFTVKVPPGANVVYRGWMLSAKDYGRLWAAVSACGANMMVSPEQYLAAHHLPNWYPRVREFTAETVIKDVSEVTVASVEALGWSGVFIKDYVKSLKTSVGSLIIDLNLVPKVIQELSWFRGGIEGGICLRRVEIYEPASERRFFVVDGKPFGPMRSEAIPDLVQTVAARIDSPFFSVDVATLHFDGVLRLVEIGDGQVSDLVGWSEERFAELWTQR